MYLSRSISQDSLLKYFADTFPWPNFLLTLSWLKVGWECRYAPSFFVGEAFSLDHRGRDAAPTGSATFQSKYISCVLVHLSDELLHSQCTRNGLSLPP